MEPKGLAPLSALQGGRLDDGIGLGAASAHALKIIHASAMHRRPAKGLSARADSGLASITASESKRSGMKTTTAMMTLASTGVGLPRERLAS